MADLVQQRQEKQEQFLEAFVETDGNLNEARKKTGVSKQAFYTWLREDEVFRSRFDSYRVSLAEEIENEAFQRVLHPTGQKGTDALATTLLKGLKPARYREENKERGNIGVVYISALREAPRVGLPAGNGTDDVPALAAGTEKEVVVDGPDKTGPS